MIATSTVDLITVNIDGKDVAVPKGTNVIEAAAKAGVDVPHYCYHPKLTVVGNCRMCLVEMGMPAVDPATKAAVMDPTTGKQKINWMPRPVIGCATNASPGLHIRTTTQLVKDCREGVMEFLLVNHPLDCPICDQAGECKLQEQATGYGRGYSRYIEDKNVKPKRTVLGPRVTLDDERCILCSRCIRFSKEIAKDDVLGFIDRGSTSTLTCFPGKKLENNYSLNTVDICPVGALTSTDFRFKMRVWFLKQTNSIDMESSVGANTVVWSREGQIYRITPRQNDEVNDTWMPDSGRILYKQVKANNRLTAAAVSHASASLVDAVTKASALLTEAKGALRIVASGKNTVEEQFLIKHVAQQLLAPVSLVSHVGEGDKILVSKDHTPNVRGALVTGLISELPKPKLTELSSDIDSGKVKLVLSFGEDLTQAGITDAQLAKITVIYCGTHTNTSSEAASVVIPTLTVFEKSGTFINQQFRLQKFSAAVPGPIGVSDDLITLTHLLSSLQGTPHATTQAAGSLSQTWKALASNIPSFAPLSFSGIPATGLLIDSTAFAKLPFVETETLHFKPVA
jgi:NADH-quinone oxidoreductase subunit G